MVKVPLSVAKIQVFNPEIRVPHTYALIFAVDLPLTQGFWWCFVHNENRNIWLPIPWDTSGNVLNNVVFHVSSSYWNKHMNKTYIKLIPMAHHMSSLGPQQHHLDVWMKGQASFVWLTCSPNWNEVIVVKFLFITLNHHWWWRCSEVSILFSDRHAAKRLALLYCKP